MYELQGARLTDRSRARRGNDLVATKDSRAERQSTIGPGVMGGDVEVTAELVPRIAVSTGLPPCPYSPSPTASSACVRSSNHWTRWILWSRNVKTTQ